MKKTMKVYIISTLLATLIFGIIVFSIMSGYSKGISVFNPDEIEVEETCNEEIKNLSGNSVNVAIILSDGESNKFFNIVLLRIDKERCESSITVFPKNTLIKYYGNNITLENINELEGDDGLIECIHAICGLTVDKFILLNGMDKINEVATKIGSLNINIPSSVVCGNIILEKGEQTIAPSLIYNLLSNNTYNTSVKIVLQYSLYTALFNQLFNMEQSSLSEDLKAIISLSDKTNIMFNDIDDNIELISNYSELQSVDAILCGNYKTVDNSEFFEINSDQTIEKFSYYRRIY